MAKNPKLTNEAANAAVNVVVDLLNLGKLRIYDGSQPAAADTAITDQTLLAELVLGNPAFGNAANGVATANDITDDADANASDTASWFRVLKADGTTKMFDGSVGVSGCDLNMDNVGIAIGGTVSVAVFTYTQPKAV